MVTMAVGRPASNNLRNSTLHARLRCLGYRLLYRGGVVARARQRNQRYAKILVYHSVAPVESDFTRGIDVTVHPETFASQLDYLMEYYHVVPLQELVNRLQVDRPVGGCVVITFDDGFADNDRYALPILRERNLPATIFLVADALDNRTVLWMHRLMYLVNTCGAEGVLRAAESALQEPFLNGRRPDAALRILREKLIWELEPGDRDRLLGTLCEMLEVSPESAPERARLYLNRAELAPMRAQGITFGCHGATHTAFAALSEAEQEQELHRTWQVVAPWTGGWPPPLAYPFGEPRHYTATTQRLALKVGHRCLLAAGGGWVTNESDLMALDRIKVEEEPLAAFAARLEGISLRSWLARLSGGSR